MGEKGPRQHTREQIVISGAMADIARLLDDRIFTLETMPLQSGERSPLIAEYRRQAAIGLLSGYAEDARGEWEDAFYGLRTPAAIGEEGDMETLRRHYLVTTWQQYSGEFEERANGLMAQASQEIIASQSPSQESRFLERAHDAVQEGAQLAFDALRQVVLLAIEGVPCAPETMKVAGTDSILRKARISTTKMFNSMAPPPRFYSTGAGQPKMPRPNPLMVATVRDLAGRHLKQVFSLALRKKEPMRLAGGLASALGFAASPEICNYDVETSAPTALALREVMLAVHTVADGVETGLLRGTAEQLFVRTWNQLAGREGGAPSVKYEPAAERTAEDLLMTAGWLQAGSARHNGIMLGVITDSTFVRPVDVPRLH